VGLPRRGSVRLRCLDGLPDHATVVVVDLFWLVPVPLPVLPAPVASDFSHESVGLTSPEQPPILLADPTPVTVIQNREVQTAPISPIQTAGVGIALFWLGGLALSFGMLIRRARQQAAILRKSKPLEDESTRRTVANIAARLGLRSTPLVRMSDAVDSPFVTGVTRPTLLLPTALWPRLADAEREIAICHECVHLQRRDLFLRWIPILAERLFFFHPLARLAAREYVLCNEAACDASVLQVLPATPGEYGNVLLAFGVSSRHATVLAGGSSSFALLKRRIAMLAVPPASSVASRSLAVALVIVAIVVLAPVRPVARSTELAPRSVATAVTPVTQAGDASQLQAADRAGGGSVTFSEAPAATTVVPKEPPRVGGVPASPVTGQNASATTPAPQQRPEAQGMERISLVAGQSTGLSTDFDITRLAVTNPAVAEAVVVQPGEVRVVGRGAGTVSLIIWGATQRKQYEIVVEPATTPTASDALQLALIQFRRHFRKGGYDGIDGHREEILTRAAELHG
jgi:beta-lactamase regulating signal transducer with metallopeptidase domain